VFAFSDGGFEVIDDFVQLGSVIDIIHELESMKIETNVSGIRNAEKKLQSVKCCIENNLLVDVAGHYLNDSAKLVRAIIFNKTSLNNWFVTWHQDRTVAVSAKFDAFGWGGGVLKMVL